MEKYESIIKRIEKYEHKMGICYPKIDGKLFKTFNIFNLLGVIYLVGINLIALLSFILVKKNTNDGTFFVSNQTMVLIALSTVAEIVSVVLLFNKNKIIGSALGLAPIPYLTFIFIKLCEGYESGLFGVKVIFYYRHLPSFLIITVCCVGMLIIALSQRIKTEKTYNRLLTNIYKNYTDAQRNENKEVSDEEWEEFITNYDPRQFKI